MSLMGYISGIILADLYFDVNLIIFFAIMSIIVSVFFLVRNLPVCAIFMCVFIVVGMGIYHITADSYKDSIKYINEHSSQIVLRIKSNPASDDKRISFDAFASDKDNERIATVRVFVNNSDAGCVKYGDIIHIRNLEVVFPEEGYNPGDMNYGKYLMSHGIAGCVYAYAEDVMYIGNRINPLVKTIYKLKDYTDKVIYNGIGGDEGGFAVALITGDKRYLSNKALQDIESAGLSHVVSVSGMHLGIFVMLISHIFSRRRRRSYISAVVNVVFCIFAVIFTGGSYSVIRAAMMVILANIGYFIGRGAYSLNSVFCVGGIIVALNPFALFDTAFVLSFAATISIIMFNDRVDGFLRDRMRMEGTYLRGIISVTFSAQILVIPILIFMKNTVNTYSLLSNIVTAPVVPFLMTSIVAAVIFSRCGVVFEVIKYVPLFISRYILRLCSTVARLPYSEIIVSDFLFVLIILLLFIYVILRYIAKCVRTDKIKKISKIYLLFCVLCVVLCMFFVRSTRVDFINVGQGDSTLIRDKGVNILIDSGGRSDIESDFGRRIVGAYLRRKGVYSLDYAFITHFDADHCQGIISVMDKVKIKKLVIPEPAESNDDIYFHNIITQKARSKGTEVLYTKYADEFVIRRGSSLRIVAPRKRTDSSNGNSLMIMYSSEGVNTLFCGDNDNEEELRAYDAFAHILKVGHHGAADSSSEEFLDRVRPRIAVISAGKNNAYSHPHKEVLRMLYKRGIHVFRTDFDGTISVELHKGKVKVRTTR